MVLRGIWVSLQQLVDRMVVDIGVSTSIQYNNEMSEGIFNINENLKIILGKVFYRLIVLCIIHLL